MLWCTHLDCLGSRECFQSAKYLREHGEHFHSAHFKKLVQQPINQPLCTPAGAPGALDQISSDALQQLRVRYPRAWQMVTNARGEVVERSVRSFCKLNKLSLPEPPTITSLVLLLNTRATTPSVSEREEGNSKKREKRWGILRKALLRTAVVDPGSDSAAVTSTVERRADADGYRFFPRVQLAPDIAAAAVVAGEHDSADNDGGVNDETYEWVGYHVGPTADGLALARHVSDTGGDVVVPIRERRCNAVLSFQELTSSLHTGVDNTGNVRVWTMEHVLCRLLLRRAGILTCGSEDSDDVLTKLLPPLAGARVLELGGGMTAFAVIALAHLSKHVLQLLARPALVLATDGNEQAVHNIKLCAAANTSCHVAVAPALRAALLRWDNFQHLARALCVEAMTEEEGRFDVVVAADVLHFEQYHSALLLALRTLLAPTATARGVFVQPLRAGTASRFAELAKQDGWKVVITPDFDNAVTNEHRRSMCASLEGEAASYDCDLHQPILITLAWSQHA